MQYNNNITLIYNYNNADRICARAGYVQEESENGLAPIILSKLPILYKIDKAYTESDALPRQENDCLQRNPIGFCASHVSAPSVRHSLLPR